MGGLYEEILWRGQAGMTVAMSDAEGVTCDSCRRYLRWPLEAASQRKYLLTDHLGSVNAVTDDAGTLLEQQRYEARPSSGAPGRFGGVREGVGSITQTDFGYTGQRDITNTGVMDYRARAYDPLLGRFLQPDTIIPSPGDPQSWNRYSYVQNSPVVFTDPTGHYDDEGCGSGDTCELPETDEPLDLKDDDEEDVLNLGISIKMETCNLLCQYATTFLGIAGTGLDTWAFAINGGFALSADVAWLFGPGGYGAVLGVYNLLQPIPNGIGIAGGLLWGAQGFLTGESYIELGASLGSTDGRLYLRSLTLSAAVSQDTVFAAGNDGFGLLIREPNIATVWSGAAVLYDITRNPLSPVVSQEPPIVRTLIQPQVSGSYNFLTQSGSLTFSVLPPLP